MLCFYIPVWFCAFTGHETVRITLYAILSIYIILDFECDLMLN